MKLIIEAFSSKNIIQLSNSLHKNKSIIIKALHFLIAELFNWDFSSDYLYAPVEHHDKGDAERQTFPICHPCHNYNRDQC